MQLHENGVVQLYGMGGLLLFEMGGAEVAQLCEMGGVQ